MFSSTPLQVVIFVKSVQRCVALAQLLIEQNFPAIAIHRGMSQEERLSRSVWRFFLHLKILFQRDVYSNRSFWSNWSQYNISDSHPHYIKFCGLKWKFQICFQQVSAVQGFPEEDSCCHQPLRPWHGHRARQHCLQLRHAWGHRHILAQSGQGWQVGC